MTAFSVAGGKELWGREEERKESKGGNINIHRGELRVWKFNTIS